MATALEVTPAHISHWELGRRLIPLDRLGALLDILSPRAEVRDEVFALWEQITYPLGGETGEWPAELWRELTVRQQRSVRQVMEAMVAPDGGRGADSSE